MAGASFTYEQAFPEVSPGAAFAATEQWLAAERSQVKVRRPPSYLEAGHGTKLQMTAWKRNARKTIQVSIVPWGEGAAVRVHIIPSAFYSGDIEMFGTAKANENYGHLVDHLFAALGGGPAVTPHQKAQVRRGDAQRARNFAFVGAFFLVGGFATLLLYPPAPSASGRVMPPPQLGPVLIGGILLVAALMSFLNSRERAG